MKKIIYRCFFQKFLLLLNLYIRLHHLCFRNSVEDALLESSSSGLHREGASSSGLHREVASSSGLHREGGLSPRQDSVCSDTDLPYVSYTVNKPIGMNQCRKVVPL